MYPDIEISTSEIRSFFTNTIYNRGVSYFRAGLVSIEQFNEDGLVATVYGSDDYCVEIEFHHDYWDMSCDCPYWDDCKHMVAVLLQAQKMLKENRTAPAEKKAKTWKQQFDAVLQNRSEDIKISEPKWKLGFTLKTLYNGWELSAKKFYNKKDGSLGRYEDYDNWSQAHVSGSSAAFRVLDMLTTLERHSHYGGYYYSSSSYAADLQYGQHVGPLFDLLQDCDLYYLERGVLQPLTVHDDGCRIEFSYEETNDTFTLRPSVILNDEKLTDLQQIAVLSRKPAYVLHGLNLFKVNNMDDAELLLPFLRNTSAIEIPKPEFGDFVSTVYARLRTRTNLPLPATVRQETISDITAKQIVLQEEPDQLRIMMQFKYGDHNILWEDDRETLVFAEDNAVTTIKRDTAAEAAAEQILKEMRTKKLDQGWRVLDSRAMNWLFKNIPILLEQGFEILGRENLKKYKVRTSTPNVNVGISSDLDWFDINLDITVEGVQLSLKELKKSLRSKSRYVKLVDNSMAHLPEDWFDRFRHLFHFAEVEEKSLKTSSLQAVMLDALFEQAQDKNVDTGFQKRLELLQQFDQIDKQALPAHFHGELRPYQKAGFDWLYFLKDYKFGGCLADDMGLGKTIQALALLQKEKELGVDYPSLVVCPTSVVYNWQKEAERFTPQLRTLIHTGIDRDKSENAFANVDVVFTTYGIMMRDFDLLQHTTFHYLVLDESQKIKNPHSQSAYVACHLKSDHRLVLTGTPVENNTLELWSQFQFINPGLLGTLHYFRSAFANPIEKYKNEDTAELLQRIVYPFILRRTKEMVAQDLPEKNEQTLLCELSESQKKSYTTWRDAFRAKILKLIDEQGLDKSKMNVLEGLTKLRQIANHPALIDPNIEEDSGKFEVLFDLVEDVVGEGHKLLIFSQFVKMLTLVRARFDKLGIAYEYLDGRTRNRQDKVDNFQNNENVRAFLISLKAGGVGLNLTAADYVIHIDPWWNPAVEMQATDRAHRIGQDKNVFVYKLITKDTVEEKIVELQERKKKLVSELVTTESGFFKNLERQDVEVLFS